jgi:hypothetical protein
MGMRRHMQMNHVCAAWFGYCWGVAVPVICHGGFSSGPASYDYGWLITQQLLQYILTGALPGWLCRKFHDGMLAAASGSNTGVYVSLKIVACEPCRMLHACQCSGASRCSRDSIG